VAHVGPLIAFMLGIVMTMLVIHILFKHLLYLKQPSFLAEPDWLFLCRQI